MITIRVTNGAGESRLFQFSAPEIHIGFRLGAEISLEPLSPKGAEIRLRESAQGEYLVEPIVKPGTFMVKGAALNSAVSLACGDVITAGVHVVVIDEILGRKAVVDDMDAPRRAVKGSGESVAAGRLAEVCIPTVNVKSPESYLVLFFAPIRQYLEDDEVSEIMINGPSSIYIERRGKVTLTDAKFLSDQALQAAVKNVAKNIGRNFNLENPRLDARMPDGSRVHAVIPPLARCGTVVAIRKFRKDKLTMAQLIEYGSISPIGAALIDAIVKLHKNVIVSGPTSSGKTSVLNVLSSSIQRNERIIVIEDASELQLQQEHVVPFETRKPDEHGKGEVTIRDLVLSSLRLRPDRLIIGEIRSGEALDMLQAMNTGHSGSMSTIHANGPVDCLSRIETCAMLSGVNIPLSAIRSQVANAVNVVVHTARLSDGSRKVTHISEVMPLKDGEYVVQHLMAFHAESLDRSGKLIGRHVGGGVKPTFYDEAVLRGIPMDESWFKL
ncbi:MAG: ATPase, T2SS/T4P/T4SS family [bacterium]